MEMEPELNFFEPAEKVVPGQKQVVKKKKSNIPPEWG